MRLRTQIDSNRRNEDFCSYYIISCHLMLFITVEARLRRLLSTKTAGRMSLGPSACVASHHH